MPASRSNAPAAVYALTSGGAVLAGKIAKDLGGDLFLPVRLAKGHSSAMAFQSLPLLVGRIFHERPAHVFVAATGIVVRVIAPWLRGKDRDPAVVALDQDGRYCVSLLSGHLGGANDLARRVAAMTGGQSVITTATDTAGAPAIDVLALGAGLAVGDVARIKRVNAALAEGRVVSVRDPGNWLGSIIDEHPLFSRTDAGEYADVVVDWRLLPHGADCLALHPPCLCLGVGCRRGAPKGDVLAAISTLLDELGAAPGSVAGLASVEAKRGEKGLLEAAEELGVPVVFYGAETLDAVDVPTPSERASRAVGTRSVSEAAALLLADVSELISPKRAFGTVTLALAQRNRP